MRAAAAIRPLLDTRVPARSTLVLGGGALLLVVVLLAGVGMGSVAISPGEVVAAVGHRLLGLGPPGAEASVAERIIVDVRLPRVLAAMLVGAGLGCAGAAFQAVLRNPLADPYIIGTAAGASLGAIVGITLPMILPGLAIGAGSAWLGLGLVQVLAFAGGMATVMVVLRVARVAGGLPSVTLLLTGYAISAVLAAAVALLMFASGRALGAIFAWLMGSLAAAGWTDLAFATPIVAVGSALLLIRWRSLNVLLLGDAPAAHLGMVVEREKLVLTLIATLVTSSVVAVAGTIGFVGLVVPHMLRLLIGPDHRLLLPASALYGAALLAVADSGARLVGGVGGGIPVGVVTALIGAPFFLWLLRRSRRLAPAMGS
jgi:iron complex transport system permease protein